MIGLDGALRYIEEHEPLKKCPFCGNEAETDISDDGFYHMICCVNCSANVSRHNFTDAYRSWQRRYKI